jgi:ATP-dependent helicase/nuclease subunit A
VPDVASRVDEDVIEADPGIRLTFIREDDVAPGNDVDRVLNPYGSETGPRPDPPPVEVFHLPLSEPVGRTAVGSLSYSSLAEYERCGYRFYVERVLGLPPQPGPDPDPDFDPGSGSDPGALERGTLVHGLLQQLDFARPALPPGTPPELEPVLAAFIDSDLCTRLGRAREIRREQRFAFVLDGTLVTGTFDVLATELERGGRLLVVDYKTGRVAPYATQALIYAIAALRTGAPAVEIVHTFLDAGESSARAYDAGDLPALEAELSERAAGLLAGHFGVADEPSRSLCAGCPALGGLCSWPLEVAMRESPDRLF